MATLREALAQATHLTSQVGSGKARHYGFFQNMSALSPPHPVPPLLLVQGGMCEVREVPKLTLTSDTSCNLVVSQITLRFNDSLEGFTDFRNAVKFTVTVYYSELMQIKISKDEVCEAVSRKVPYMELPIVPSQ